MKTAISEIQLNAFVDGELSRTDAVYVASVIAADPGVAKRVRQLHQMKAALGGFSENLSLPEIFVPVAPPRRHFWRMAVVFRSVAMVLALLLIPVPASQTASPDTGQTILTQHDRWLSDIADMVALDLPEGFDWIAPVMSASGLQLVHIQTDIATQHLGFKGQNACRLSLFVSEAGQADNPLNLTLSDEIQQAQWQIAGFAFEMIARDMAIGRFATVATGLKQESRAHGAGSELQIALLQSARLPCLS